MTEPRSLGPSDSHDGQQNDREPNRRKIGADRRRSVVDRRDATTGLERRRGPGRRRNDFSRAAEEGEMTDEQFLFIKVIEAYKRVNERPYPSWTEVLEVIRKLGYRKTSSSELQLDAIEDWTEAPDAPTFAPVELEAGDDL